MKVVVDGERLRFEFAVDFYRYKNVRWLKRSNWRFEVRRGLDLVTPLGFLDVYTSAWLEEPERPLSEKWSRSKRLTVTLEYGNIPGYKE